VLQERQPAQGEHREGPPEEQLKPPVVPLQSVVLRDLAKENKAMHRDEVRREQHIAGYAEDVVPEQRVPRDDPEQQCVQQSLQQQDADNDQRELRHGPKRRPGVPVCGDRGGRERVLRGDHDSLLPRPITKLSLRRGAARRGWHG
jgi:hypothetical protein